MTVIAAATIKNNNGNTPASAAIVSFMLSNAVTDGKLSRSSTYMNKPAAPLGSANILFISSALESENLSKSLSSVFPSLIIFIPLNTSTSAASSEILRVTGTYPMPSTYTGGKTISASSVKSAMSSTLTYAAMNSSGCAAVF